jgi:hypothetical protein
LIQEFIGPDSFVSILIPQFQCGDFFDSIGPSATSAVEPGMSAFKGEAVVPQTSAEVRV